MELTQEYIKSVLHYDPDTGVFTRLKGRRQGFVAGVKDNTGYLRIKFCGVGFHCHRLAFLWMTGSLPKDCVDHINGNQTDNRWHNLRPASTLTNGQIGGFQKTTQAASAGYYIIAMASGRRKLKSIRKVSISALMTNSGKPRPRAR